MLHFYELRFQNVELIMFTQHCSWSACWCSPVHMDHNICQRNQVTFATSGMERPWLIICMNYRHTSYVVIRQYLVIWNVKLKCWSSPYHVFSRNALTELGSGWFERKTLCKLGLVLKVISRNLYVCNNCYYWVENESSFRLFPSIIIVFFYI